MKNRRLCGELKEYVPITARAKRFALKKGKSTIITERKQFLLTLRHAITVHKSQRSTLAYMQGDLNWSTGKKTATGQNYQQPICQDQFYTSLSHAKSCDKVLLLHFEPEDIKVNKSALDEMVRMRNESLFSRQHPSIEVNGISVSIYYKVVECSFRKFSQWQDILNVFQLTVFHRNQYKLQSCKTNWWNPAWLERHP